MMAKERVHGKCTHCKERFHLTDRHVAYGGLLWCSLDHLAEWTVEHEGNPLRSSVDKIAREYEIRGGADA